MLPASSSILAQILTEDNVASFQPLILPSCWANIALIFTGGNFTQISAGDTLESVLLAASPAWDTISGYEDQQDDLDHIKDHNDGNNLPSVCSRHLTGYKARDYRAAGTVTRSPIRVRALSRKDLIYLAN